MWSQSSYSECEALIVEPHTYVYHYGTQKSANGLSQSEFLTTFSSNKSMYRFYRVLRIRMRIGWRSEPISKVHQYLLSLSLLKPNKVSSHKNEFQYTLTFYNNFISYVFSTRVLRIQRARDSDDDDFNTKNSHKLSDWPYFYWFFVNVPRSHWYWFVLWLFLFLLYGDIILFVADLMLNKFFAFVYQHFDQMCILCSAVSLWTGGTLSLFGRIVKSDRDILTSCFKVLLTRHFEFMSIFDKNPLTFCNQFHSSALESRLGLNGSL